VRSFTAKQNNSYYKGFIISLKANRVVLTTLRPARVLGLLTLGKLINYRYLKGNFPK